MYRLASFTEVAQCSRKLKTLSAILGVINKALYVVDGGEILRRLLNGQHSVITIDLDVTEFGVTIKMSESTSDAEYVALMSMVEGCKEAVQGHVNKFEVQDGRIHVVLMESWDRQVYLRIEIPKTGEKEDDNEPARIEDIGAALADVTTGGVDDRGDHQEVGQGEAGDDVVNPGDQKRRRRNNPRDKSVRCGPPGRVEQCEAAIDTNPPE